MVSHTQESTTAPVIQELPSNRHVIASASPPAPLVGSPNINNTAIANINAGTTNNDEGNDDVFDDKHTRMVLFNDKNAKHKTIKLTATSVFNFLCHGFVKTLSDDLLAARRTASSSAASVRKARSSFDTLTYKRQVKVDPGKSRRIAEKQQRKVSPTPLGSDVTSEKDVSIFDVKKATSIIPDVDWDNYLPSFNLDSRKLRPYVVEDVMFANPNS